MRSCCKLKEGKHLCATCAIHHAASPDCCVIFSSPTDLCRSLIPGPGRNPAQLASARNLNPAHNLPHSAISPPLAASFFSERRRLSRLLGSVLGVKNPNPNNQMLGSVSNTRWSWIQISPSPIVAGGPKGFIGSDSLTAPTSSGLPVLIMSAVWTGRFAAPKLVRCALGASRACRQAKAELAGR